MSASIGGHDRTMTPEQRLDRIERIAKLLVKAGVRARREMNEKINILIDAQIRNDERFAQLAEAMTRLAEKSQETDRKFAQMAESQAHSDRRLDTLIDTIRKEREGSSGQS